MNKFLLSCMIVFGTLSNVVASVVFPDIQKNLTNPEELTITGHIQGFAADSQNIYWVGHDTIIKTDFNCKIIKQIPLKKEDGKSVHGGDPVVVDGKLYVPYAGNSFNFEPKKDEFIYNYIQEYDIDLNYIKTYHIPEIRYGVGGITFANGHFFVVGGRPWEKVGNEIYEFDRDFKFIKSYYLPFNTVFGIQTVTFDGEYFYFGVYGNNTIPRANKDFTKVDYFSGVTGSLGMIPLANKKMLLAKPQKLENQNGAIKLQAEIVDLAKVSTPVQYVTVDKNGNLIHNGNKILITLKYRGLAKKFKNQRFIVRCAEDIPIPILIAAYSTLRYNVTKNIEVEYVPNK